MLEKGKVSSSQILFLMIGFVQGSSVLLSPGIGAGNMGWLALLLGLGESMIFAWIYTTLILRFPGKTLIEISETVYGKMLGKLVALAFIYYLFHLGSFVVRNFLDFIKLAILPDTPASVILLVGLVVCAYGARSGLEVLGRVSQFLIIVSILLFLIMIAMLVNEIHFERFLPLFNVPLKKLLWSAHGAATFPFGETVVFVMALPYVNQQKDIRKTVFLSLVLAGSILLIAAVRTYGVLGRTSEIFVYPNFYVTKMINIGHVFTRMEIIFAANLLVYGFIKIAVLLYGAALGTAQLLQLSDYRPLVFPIGVLVYLMAVIDFADVAENVEFATNVYPIYSIPFIVGIPLLTLTIALLRGIPKGGASQRAS